jgi:hypothetical protein
MLFVTVSYKGILMELLKSFLSSFTVFFLIVIAFDLISTQIIDWEKNVLSALVFSLLITAVRIIRKR